MHERTFHDVFSSGSVKQPPGIWPTPRRGKSPSLACCHRRGSPFSRKESKTACGLADVELPPVISPFVHTMMFLHSKQMSRSVVVSPSIVRIACRGLKQSTLGFGFLLASACPASSAWMS